MTDTETIETKRCKHCNWFVPLKFPFCPEIKFPFCPEICALHIAFKHPDRWDLPDMPIEQYVSEVAEAWGRDLLEQMTAVAVADPNNPETWT